MSISPSMFNLRCDNYNYSITYISTRYDFMPRIIQYTN